MDRYIRQTIADNWGEEGQQKIENTTVLVVGAGGLGSYGIEHLARAGIEHLHIVDFSKTTMSNLNRQILYTDEDIGVDKVETLPKKLHSINKNVKVKTYKSYIDDIDLDSLEPRPDIILSCVDNMKTRLKIANLGLKYSLPIVEMSVSGFYGIVLTTLPDDPCLFCAGTTLEEQRPIPAIGPVVGTISSIGTTEIIKWILGLDLQRSELLYIDLISNDMEKIPISLSADCPIHGNEKQEER